MKRIERCTMLAVSLGLLILACGTRATAAGPNYFPTGIGSSWSFSTQTLTLSGFSQVMMTGTETVVVQGDGRFHSTISLPNGNTVDSLTSYTTAGQALYLTGNVNTMHTVNSFLPGSFTETTTTNTYVPDQMAFPASTTPGSQESTNSVANTHLTGFTHFPFPGVPDTPMTPTDSVSQQLVNFTVGAIESVTVPAGTFQALKLVLDITVTEDGLTNTMTVNEWFAPGVGLVKMDSPNMKRDLLPGYSVAPGGGTPPQLTVSLSGTGGGSINSNPSGFTCTTGTCIHPYPAGGSLDLISLPDADSVFAGWSGDCTGSLCTLATGADHSVTATFNASPFARMGALGYGTLQSACNAVSSDATITARTRTFSENLTFSKPWRVGINGGYDSNFTARTGFSAVHGRVNVAMGTLVANLLKVY